MFTGIVAAVGRIVSVVPLAAGVRLAIESADLGLDDVAIGDSIAIQGACMTVVARESSRSLGARTMEQEREVEEGTRAARRAIG